MFNALIIDDEAHIRDTLSKLLKRYCPEIIRIEEASSVANGIKEIPQLNPNLVFLDMNLGDGSAFDLLHALKEVNFGVVFMSTFDQQMIQSLKLSGLDYLQKPFNPMDLMDVVERSENQDISNFSLQLTALEDNLRSNFQ